MCVCVCVLHLSVIATGSSGEITFTGLPADRVMPLFLEITAFSQFGQQLAFITRPVRIGMCMCLLIS